jgi:hypothetical protein
LTSEATTREHLEVVVIAGALRRPASPGSRREKVASGAEALEEERVRFVLSFLDWVSAFADDICRVYDSRLAVPPRPQTALQSAFPEP